MLPSHILIILTHSFSKVTAKIADDCSKALVVIIFIVVSTALISLQPSPFGLRPRPR